MVQIFLKPAEHPADFLGLTQVFDGIRQRITVFQPQQRCQFFLVQFLDANADVVRQHEVDEHLRTFSVPRFGGHSYRIFRDDVEVLGDLDALGAGASSSDVGLVDNARVGFAQESWTEAKKVVWPSRKETIQTTMVVFGLVFVMALFLWAVDWILWELSKMFVGRS